MNRDEELARLIAEQQVDMRQGRLQKHEPHVAYSLNQMPDYVSPPREGAIACPVHGMGAMVRWGGTNRCRQCNVEAAERYRRRKGIRPRGGCYRHGYEAWHITPSGRAYCNIERRWARAIRTRKEQEKRRAA
jgi:hypothetical protein